MQSSTTRRTPWLALAGGVAVLAVAGVLALVLLSGDDDGGKAATAAARPAAQAAGAGGEQLPNFAFNYPDTWRPVEAGRKAGEPPTAVIRRKDGTGMIRMTIRGPVKQSLRSLRGEMATELRQRFPGLSNLQFRRIKAEAGDGLLSTWVGKNGRVQSNLVVPSGKVSYSLDAIVTPGKDKTASEVGKIYAAFDAEPAR